MLSLSPIAMILASVGFRVLELTMLPLSKGLTAPMPTLAFAANFMVGLGPMARLSHHGVDLGLLGRSRPRSSPFGVIAVGVLYYGKAAPLTKISLLIVACRLIGLASVLG